MRIVGLIRAVSRAGDAAYNDNLQIAKSTRFPLDSLTATAQIPSAPEETGTRLAITSQPFPAPMFTINFTKRDERLNALARAYWSARLDGKWVHPVAELEETFSVRRGCLPQELKSCCHVTLVGFDCVCGAPPTVTSRADFAAFLKAWKWAQAGLRTYRCHSCLSVEEARRRQMQRQMELLDAQRKSQWLDECTERLAPRSYLEAAVGHAFMLLGLLRYGDADLIAGELAPWSICQPRLWMDEAAVRAVYDELYATGWIAPTVGSLPHAIAVNQDRGMRVAEPLAARWKLARDNGGLPYTCLEGALQARLGVASSSELHGVWEWVCVNHVRATFDYYRTQYRLGGKGWTDAVEASVRKLLTNCSVAQVRALVRSTVRELALEMLRGEKHPAHVRNMLSGELLRRGEFFKANGGAVFAAPRLARRLESLYTGLLFDTVLGGGTELYQHLTGDAMLGDSK